MKNRTENRLQRSNGFSQTKLFVIIGAVVIVVIVGIVVYSVSNRSDYSVTPPTQPIDSTERVIQKEPQSSDSGQSTNSALPQ